MTMTQRAAIGLATLLRAMKRSRTFYVRGQR